MSFERARAQMLSQHLEARGILDERVLEAFARVPREVFIPEALHGQVYADHPLPIGDGQTISQPYIVAEMLSALNLDGSETVLEVGVGSGYQTALLAVLTRWVYGIERHIGLLSAARTAIESLGLNNVALRVGDGTLGWREQGPYDAIVVSAAAPEVPEPLLSQLAVGGRMVIPVGPKDTQTLLLLTHGEDGQIYSEQRQGCRFVPLIGRFGWAKQT